MEQLFEGFLALTGRQAVMMGVGAVLLYLAIEKEYEPSLLLPMGFGTLLVNIPFTSALTRMAGDHLQHGALSILFDAGIANEMFPLLIFIAIGAMIDFTPLFQNPVTFLFGLTAQAGIFLTMGLALLFGFDLKEAASIGIIGAADGPTSIYVSARFAPHLLGPISVAAYSYMALVPVIQPPVIKLLTTAEERKIPMPYHEKPVSRRMKILFPIGITLAAGMFAPPSASLIGFLMFGNLLRESGVVDRLAKGAQNELANIVTILLGLAISATMTGERFIQPQTILILSMGLVAFILDTAAGVLSAKAINLFRKQKLNPMIGASGISAFPMSARLVQKMAAAEDRNNFILMHAVGANVSGQIGSVLAGGLLLAFLG
ncbi:sodium ion-translocating decarboxylase subunit beta [Aminivibrio sp.]|jgi:oxaloacetate decarboxylase beta subunit|uniref:sodium ion-translocating decarboxylase subunit beta n=1 Tax=Aminivibrio sp. TaxID=1872489 RepID=UPI001A58F5C3|nr:sodium ion-translocating decarboxylase subunit beta [Aminivibrio sp.]MBL3538826.1 sodium ion-translocating decarboxylase subunit beta [Aminivibrio sp.]MDK2958661.1 carboxybiotin decarboxylase [Synergistaceae bacterium]